MHIHFLDPYRARVSLIHQLDARVKLALAGAFILATAALPPGEWGIYALLFSISLAVSLLSEIGPRYVLQRASVALLFMLAAAPLLFTTPGQAWLVLPFGSLTYPGLERFLSLAAKAWLSLQMAILLTATTPFPALLQAMRAFKLPRLLVAIFGMMWRYLFVLADEALRLLRARAARSSQITERRPTGGAVLWRAQVTGGMAGNLFLRAFERGDRIYAAMAARGYDGDIRTLANPPLARAQKVILATGGLLLLGLVGLAYLV